MKTAGAAQAPPLRSFPRPLRLVLSDLDDTLCDYSAARERRLRLAFSGGIDPAAHDHLNLDLDRMVAASIALHPHGSDHFPRLFANFGFVDPAPAHRAARWYRDNPFFGLDLVPEALSVIARVRSLACGAIGIGVVTNGPTQIQREKVTLLGVDRLVDFVLVSEEFGVAKPDRAIFEEALRLGGAVADEAIVVGDSLDYDIAGARAADIASVWVNSNGSELVPSEPQPDHIIRRLEQFPSLLQYLRLGSNGC